MRLISLYKLLLYIYIFFFFSLITTYAPWVFRFHPQHVTGVDLEMYTAHFGRKDITTLFPPFLDCFFFRSVKIGFSEVLLKQAVSIPVPGAFRDNEIPWRVSHGWNLLSRWIVRTYLEAAKETHSINVDLLFVLLTLFHTFPCLILMI